MMRLAPTPSRARRSAALAALAAAAASGCALAPPAGAAPDLHSWMMDDDALVYSHYQERESTIWHMRRIGVDGLRVTVSWKFVSGEENRKPRRRPARLTGKRAEDPRSYRRDIWDRFDDIVRLAQANGMDVLFNVTGPGPVWAHPRAPRAYRFDQPAWRPRVADFKRFVKAVGRRYDGTYRDENQDRQPLPRVTLWSIWNEPNQPASLAPQLQFNRRLRKQVPVAPILYRKLYYAATDALRETGHGSDRILMGETAPLGAVRKTPRIHLWPKLFLQEMFCLRPNGRPFTGLAARVRQCGELRRRGPFLVTGFAHHPYTQRNPPTRRDKDPRSINSANLADLPALLDQIAATTGLIPAGLPIALTESGWETMPPDPTRGVSLKKQEAWVNLSQHLSYDAPRVFADTQFVLRDVKPRAKYRGNRKRLVQYWATWQSGLLFANGKPKPAFAAYVMPFDLRRGEGGQYNAWGQLRLIPKGSAHDVHFQFRPAGSGDWQPVGGPFTVQTPLGYYETTLPELGPGSWRAVMLFGDQAMPVYSREIYVSR
jgi:hypothetical protein